MTQTSQAAVLEVLRDTAAGYARLVAGNAPEQWPELKLVAVTVSATHGLDPKQALRMGEPGNNGWMRHRSAAYRTDEGKPADVTDDAIAGEWSAAGGGASVHLRQDPDNPGKLARWDYAERLLADGDSLREGERPALRQRITVMARSGREVSLAQRATQPVIVYHVFWGANPSDPHAVRRLFARFVAFAMERIVMPGRPPEHHATQGTMP